MTCVGFFLAKDPTPAGLYRFRRLRYLIKFVKLCSKACRPCFDQQLSKLLVEDVGPKVPDLRRYLSEGYVPDQADQELGFRDDCEIWHNVFMALHNALNAVGLKQQQKEASLGGESPYHLGDAIRFEIEFDYYGEA